jgi:hypothetical protein
MHTMSMIDRYKKKGGFVQLLNLIETTGKDKQDKFMKLIADENPAWEAEVRKKMLSLDKIVSWNENYLAEIFPRIPTVQMAMILGGLPPDKAEVFKKVLIFKERKACEDILAEKKPTPAESSTSVNKLFAEIRKMVQEGALKFEKFDESMVIPENIEEQLNTGRILMSVKELDASMAAASSSANASGATGSGSFTGVANGNPSEEMLMLRRKLVQLTQDNTRLMQENQNFRERLDQIKKIA